MPKKKSEHKTQKSFPKKFTPGTHELKVKRSVAGLGLFALSPIARKTCVVEYTGKRLSKKEEEASNSLYLFDLGRGFTIDGATRKNLARYVNHSCRPNCEIDIYARRVFVMAKRNIKAGEELTYDYDKDYFDAYIKPKGCRCVKCAPRLWANSPSANSPSGRQTKSPQRRPLRPKRPTRKKGS